MMEKFCLLCIDHYGRMDIQTALNLQMIMAPTPVNLKKLSEILGLSQTTVSRALNGFPEVSEKTRIRVREAALALNYRPSPSAASLATGKTRIIGHVIPVSEHRMINPHFTDFLAGASETYAAAGYDLLLRMVAPNEKEDEIYREFASRRRVDGVIVHGPKTLEPRIELLKSIGLPFVAHGRTGDETSSYSWLDVNNLNAFKRATQYLIDQGHTRIGLINGIESMNFAMRRRAGYEKALLENNIQLSENYITSADMTEPYGHQATMEKLDMPDAPTAFLYSSILPAMGGFRALSERGLRPGSDVAIINFDDQLSFLQSPNSYTQQPFFTSMRSSIQAAGKRVAEMLIQQINEPTKEPIQELWEAEFIRGRTA